MLLLTLSVSPSSCNKGTPQNIRGPSPYLIRSVLCWGVCLFFCMSICLHAEETKRESRTTEDMQSMKLGQFGHHFTSLASFFFLIQHYLYINVFWWSYLCNGFGRRRNKGQCSILLVRSPSIQFILPFFMVSTTIRVSELHLLEFDRSHSNRPAKPASSSGCPLCWCLFWVIGILSESLFGVLSYKTWKKKRCSQFQNR